MSVTADALRPLVGAGPADADLLASAVAVATELVIDYIDRANSDGTATVSPVILDRAILRCAVEVFNQDKAPNGVLNQQYLGGDSQVAVRISRDPLKPAEAILAPYFAPLGFA